MIYFQSRSDGKVGSIAVNFLRKHGCVPNSAMNVHQHIVPLGYNIEYHLRYLSCYTVFSDDICLYFPVSALYQSSMFWHCLFWKSRRFGMLLDIVDCRKNLSEEIISGNLSKNIHGFLSNICVDIIRNIVIAASVIQYIISILLVWWGRVNFYAKLPLGVGVIITVIHLIRF